jgi:hypothetical protein
MGVHGGSSVDGFDSPLEEFSLEGALGAPSHGQTFERFEKAGCETGKSAPIPD